MNILGSLSRKWANCLQEFFVTIIPAIAILRAGLEGNLDWVIKLVTENENPNFMYFWMTGMLSSFLDNAPTYIVFFETGR